MKKRKNYQIKVYTKNRKAHIRNDKTVTAKKPGKRKSKGGTTYTERRENRSDKSRKTRL